jgi:hypothetical protein
MATSTEMRDVEAARNREFHWLAAAICALLVIATVIMVFSYDSTDAGEPTSAASDKAKEFISALDKAGLQQPDRDSIARVYGTDGGRACTMSKSEINQALSAFNAQRTGEINGRPGLLDPRARTYERTMMQTYCPDRLEAYDDFVADLRFDRTRPAA